MNAYVTRTSIGHQLRDFCEAAELPFGVLYLDSGITYRIDGHDYTPAQAADRFLPGGHLGAFGQAGKAPTLRVGQRLRLAPDGLPVYAEVIDILGAADYADGFLALCRITDHPPTRLPDADHNDPRPTPDPAAEDGPHPPATDPAIPSATPSPRPPATATTGAWHVLPA